MKLLHLLKRWLSSDGGTSPRAEKSPAANIIPTPNPPRPDAPVIRSLQGKAQRKSGWVPPDRTVSVKGVRLGGGFLYVGDSRDVPSIGRGVPDPALINPSLPVDFRHPDHAGELMDYWPSYSDISPSCRAAYLEWLAAGRPGGAYIGYVFLFFYGLERRVLVDAPNLPEAKADIPLIVSEVRRLLALYETNSSFRGYATDFLTVARLVQGLPDVTALTPPPARTSWDFPLELKIALGAFVRHGQPIPGEWALSWLKSHPDLRLRTPATRCSTEFHDLFLLRYSGAFGDGMTIRPNRTPLRLTYRPASAAFGRSLEINVGDFPDITRLSAPVKRLNTIADRVSDELDAYSRWVGRHGTDRNLASLALLPSDLAAQTPELRQFTTWLEQQVDRDDRVSVSVPELLARWSSKPTKTLARREAESLCRTLDRCGFGIEPDMRFSGINLSNSASATLFRLPTSASTEPTEAYGAAAALARLGTLIALADGQITTDEQQFLHRFLANALLLGSVEQTRLRAHLHWLMTTPASFAGLKERCAALDEHQRTRFGQFLISVAGADGQITADELKVLSKTYRLLGLNPNDVPRDVHALATSTPDPAEPVIIAPADDDVPIFTVPHAPAAPSKSVTLSSERVAAILTETALVRSVLGTVFEDDEPEPSPPDEPPVPEPEADGNIPGLDVSHSAMVRHLSERPRWSRYEVDQLSERLGLMTAGALEIINDAAFDSSDEPFAEGDDPVEINAEVFKIAASM